MLFSHLRKATKPQRLDKLDPSRVRLTVVIPVFNEANTIAVTIETVLKQKHIHEIVVVDDCSTDGTWEVLNSLSRRAPEKSIRILRHEINQGKGAALRSGFALATGDLVLVQDADTEYDPEDYSRLLEPLLGNKADVVFGSRFAGGSSHRVLYFWHSLGNKLLTLLSNVTTDLNLSDMECGYKVFRREIIQSIKIRENRFGFEPEIVAKVARTGARIFEVGVSYNGRTYAEGKKVNWKDGFSALRCILRYGL